MSKVTPGQYCRLVGQASRMLLTSAEIAPDAADAEIIHLSA